MQVALHFFKALTARVPPTRPNPRTMATNPPGDDDLPAAQAGGCLEADFGRPNGDFLGFVFGMIATACPCRGTQSEGARLKRSAGRGGGPEAGLFLSTTRLMKTFIIVGLFAVFSGCSSFKGNPSQNTTKMTCLNESYGSPKDVQVKVGDTFCLLYGRHPSVGSDVDFLSADDGGVVRFRGERSEYQNPKRANMPGGDGQSVRFVFEAMKPGQVTLTFQLMFRGDVKDTPVHKITVEPK
ncbi:MAG: protease inhibitor I42 family protein [Elusimicrobiota bacterium]